MTAATSMQRTKSGFAKQNIEITESSTMMDGKVASVKTPNPRLASARSETGELNLTRIEDMDTSGMKLILTTPS